MSFLGPAHLVGFLLGFSLPTDALFLSSLLGVLVGFLLGFSLPLDALFLSSLPGVLVGFLLGFSLPTDALFLSSLLGLGFLGAPLVLGRISRLPARVLVASVGAAQDRENSS